MSRTRNKRIGLVDGSRKVVLSARQLNDKPRQWRLELACGHTVDFTASEQPKHVRCPKCPPGAVVAETAQQAALRALALGRLSPPRPQESCVDCGGPLIPCTCRPDCPGGMCARPCGGETLAEYHERLARPRAAEVSS